MRSLFESIFRVSSDPNKAGKDIQDAMGIIFTLRALGVPDDHADTIKGYCIVEDGVLKYDPKHDATLILAPKKDVKDQLDSYGINGINAMGTAELYLFHKGPDNLDILNDKTFCKNIYGYRIDLEDYRDISNINLISDSHITISSHAPIGARNLNVDCNILTINAPMALSDISGTVRDSIKITLDKRQGPNLDRVFKEIFKISYKDYKDRWYYNQMLDIPSDILSNPFCDTSHIKASKITMQFDFNDGRRINFIAQKFNFDVRTLKAIKELAANDNKRLAHYRHYYKSVDIDGWHCLLYT